MAREAESISTLSAVSPLLGYMPGSVGALYQLYHAISPEMPADLESTRADVSSNEDIPAFYFNYDEGHAGRFSVPDTNGASVAFDWVMSQHHPPQFALRNLTFYDGVIRGNVELSADQNTENSPDGEESNGAAAEEEEEGNGEQVEEQIEHPTVTEEQELDGAADADENDATSTDANGDASNDDGNERTAAVKGNDRAAKTSSKPSVTTTREKEEFIVFIPGLNTVHQPREGESTTIERLRHYVRVLNVPMSQVHMGTSFDQGNVRVDPGPGRLIRVLFSSPLIPDSLKSGSSGSAMEWDSRQLDRLQAALSKANAITTPVKEAVRGLVNAVLDAPSATSFGPPLVIVGYSRGSIEVEAALRGLIKSRLEVKEDGETTMTRKELEEKLRERVTIVTVGAATNRFPDGPAYVHIAAWTDPLASSSGVTQRHDASGGGRDAVFINCDSPYHSEAFDNHNFGAITAQYVSLILAHNGAHGFRQLWDIAHAGKLRIPPKVNDLTRALIQLTRGYEWLWNSDAAWRDIPFGALPSREDAINLLRTHMGKKFVNRILHIFPSEE